MKLVEFLLGTDEERAAADEINALVAQYPTWKVKDQLDALRDLTRGLVFRRTAAGMALATVLGVGAIVSSGNNKEAPDKDSIVSSAEAMESYELTLGNVTFFLKDKNSLGGKGRAELFETLKKSYDSLCDYFGDELLTFSYPLRLPIEIETNGVPIDEVESSIEMAYDKDGVPRATQRPTFVKLKIADLNEDVIAHELFHLFLQGNDVGTQAFLEGHAHVVQRKLYAAEVGRNPWDVGEIVNIPQVKEITDLGLDSYIMDRKYGGGAQSLLLERFLRSRWEGLWSDYLKIDSTFLKKFYKRLRSVREVSDKYYSPSKAELVRMGEAVSPGFEKWFKAQAAFEDLDFHAPRESAQALFMPTKLLLLVTNFVTHKRKMKGEEITPPFLTTKYAGDLNIVIKTEDNVFVKNFLPQQNEPGITLVNLAGLDFNNACEVFIGDNKLPLIVSEL